MEYVKICGLKNYNEVKLCIDGKANAVGFIYNIPDSPRNVQKKELIDILNRVGDKILTVIVLKPSNILELEEIMKDIPSSLYQIHINFEIQKLKILSNEFKKKIIVALKVNKNNKKFVVEQINKFGNQFFAFLIDNSEGHGNELDTEIVNEILEKTDQAKIIVAGGININNVEHIINKLKIYGIDISSSLESEKGVKDALKIKNFLEIIKKIKKIKREN